MSIERKIDVLNRLGAQKPYPWPIAPNWQAGVVWDKPIPWCPICGLALPLPDHPRSERCDCGQAFDWSAPADQEKLAEARRRNVGEPHGFHTGQIHRGFKP